MDIVRLYDRGESIGSYHRMRATYILMIGLSTLRACTPVIMFGVWDVEFGFRAGVEHSCYFRASAAIEIQAASSSIQGSRLKA